MALCDYLSKYNKSAVEKYEADITVVVSKSGDDNALGTEDAPFLTPERAIEELKKIRTSHPKKTVAIKIMGGTYFTDGLYLPKEAGGEKSTPVIIFSYDDAELSCGVRLDASKFSLVGGEEAIRLSEKARKNVYVCDLRSLGLDEDDWGPVYPTGTAQTTALYPGKKKGVNCELVINDRRMTLARYPDEGFIKLEGVISEGFVVADGFGVSRECEKPDPGCFDVGEEVSRRIDGWRDKDDIWMMGFFKYDWAESSTRVFPDTKNHTITPELASRFGVKAGAPYYLFNIFEELDRPGEWFLDRKKGLLYVWPTAPIDEAEIYFSYKKSPVITIENADNIIFDGLKIRHTLSCGIKAEGNGVKIKRCDISCVAGNAIEIEGYDNEVRECEISHMGCGGIKMKAGERATLTAGRCLIENNSIHDFGQVCLTYYAGVDMRGVGITCRHNEIFNSPHSAIIYAGNDHLIEYNYIHDTVQITNDAGAIYSGRNWTDHGTMIRYNVVENSGDGEHTPCAIYWDDGLSGQTAYSNLIIHTGDNGIKFGGGRELEARYNIIFDAGEPFQYDDRMRVAIEDDGWTKNLAGSHETIMWKRLYEMPYKSELWARKYPLVAKIKDDMSLIDDPDMALNPSYSTVEKNVIICSPKANDMICDSVYVFSKVENNPRFEIGDDVGFNDETDGDFRMKENAKILQIIPDFPEIPYKKIGRY